MNSGPVVILAGGEGTRLRSEVSDVPKVLAPVNSKPFLYYLIQSLYQQGARHFVLSLHYLAQMVIDYIQSQQWPEDLKFDYAVESELLGTGGALKFVGETINYKGIIAVVNGDTFLTSGFKQFLKNPISQRENSIVLVKVKDASRYGTVRFNSDMQVTDFAEKNGATSAAWINSGIYSILVDDLARYPKVFSMERDFFPQLVQSARLYAIPVESDFIDIGIPEDYRKFIQQSKLIESEHQ